jgi:hypothetical protein
MGELGAVGVLACAEVAKPRVKLAAVRVLENVDSKVFIVG